MPDAGALEHGAFEQAGDPPRDDARRAGVRHRVHDLFRVGARRRHGGLHRACAVGVLRRPGAVSLLTGHGRSAGHCRRGDGQGAAAA